MRLKPAKDRIAILRDVILRFEKSEDPALDPVMKANLGRLLLDYIAEFDAEVSIESPCQQHPSSPIRVCRAAAWPHKTAHFAAKPANRKMCSNASIGRSHVASKLD